PNKFNELGKFQPSRPPSLAKSLLPLQERASGEMAEWLKAHAWKACVRETVPWVRIPLSPPWICSPSFATVRKPTVRIEFFRSGRSRLLAATRLHPHIRRGYERG